MLAYVFWHWPDPDLAAPAYEQLLGSFHDALKRNSPPGFQRSTVFRIGGSAAWLAGAPAYADWYLVNDSAALDALNVTAVSGDCEQPHAEVARAAAAGAGSLLALRGDDPRLDHARHAVFMAKPKGMPYDEFYSQVAALPDASTASLWRRQMVLGPTPEFALLSSTALNVPAQFQPLALGLTPIT